VFELLLERFLVVSQGRQLLAQLQRFLLHSVAVVGDRGYLVLETLYRFLLLGDGLVAAKHLALGFDDQSLHLEDLLLGLVVEL